MGSLPLQGLSSVEREMRSIQWGWVAALQDLAGRDVNTREMTSAERAALSHMAGKGVVDKVKQIPVEGAKSSGSGGAPGTPAEREVCRIRTREDTLSFRAKKHADEIRGDPARIRGMFGVAHVNPKWVRAVRSFLKKGSIRTAVTSENAVDKKTAEKVGKCTTFLIGAWSCKEVGPLVEHEAPAKPGDMAREEDKSDKVQYSRCMVQAMRFAGIAAKVQSLNVCPHCFFHGTEMEPQLDEGRYAGKSLDELREVDLNRLLKKDSEGWLSACAALHNREMHASNGNIQYTSTGAASRVDVSLSTIKEAYDIRAVRGILSGGPAVLRDDFQRRASVMPYTPANGTTWAVPSIGGTSHQFVTDWDKREGTARVCKAEIANRQASLLAEIAVLKEQLGAGRT
uniref:Uncharacterized protein n=1 Tax=Glossina morsitans morsitans TaxID=37546 RepID=A0ABK9NGA2_GLOMM